MHTQACQTQCMQYVFVYIYIYTYICMYLYIYIHMYVWCWSPYQWWWPQKNINQLGLWKLLNSLSSRGRLLRPGSIKVSRLNAPNMPPTAPPPPRRGKNQWAKSMAPNLVVHTQRLFKGHGAPKTGSGLANTYQQWTFVQNTWLRTTTTGDLPCSKKMRLTSQPFASGSWNS